jgi:hypothetical protein
MRMVISATHGGPPAVSRTVRGYFGRHTLYSTTHAVVKITSFYSTHTLYILLVQHGSKNWRHSLASNIAAAPEICNKQGFVKKKKKDCKKI